MNYFKYIFNNTTRTQNLNHLFGEVAGLLMEAKLGRKASYALISIIKARNVIHEAPIGELEIESQ